ncbi:hypothetical protein HI914_03292 [Erysiphe necator]|nr:hypothetical protein HI914_03292 [Erysiphe necator]
MVWSTLVQQNDAYPLHNALSIAWTIAEKHQSWMVQFSFRPQDRQFLPRFIDLLRSVQRSVESSLTPIFDDPIVTVNAATAQKMYYIYGKIGHYSIDCNRKKLKRSDNQNSSKQEIYETFKAHVVTNKSKISKRPSPPLPPRSLNMSASVYANQAIQSNVDEIVEQWDSDDFQEIKLISDFSDNNDEMNDFMATACLTFMS